MRRIARGAALAASLFCLSATAAMACPGCKEALLNPGQLHEKLLAAKGYALSIGVLLAVPAALIGGIAIMIIRTARKSWRR